MSGCIGGTSLPPSFNFYDKVIQSIKGGNNFAPDDLVFMSDDNGERKTELPMTGINESNEIDRPTSWSICRAIGERLQQNLRPEHSELPSSLRNLLDELRRKERRA